MRSRSSLTTLLLFLVPIVSTSHSRAQADAPEPGAPESAAPSDPPAGAEVPPEPVEEEPAPSEDEAMEGEDPARPPPKGKGVVWGVVTDTTMKEPLPEALIEVLQTKQRVTADLDGRFRLELAPGTYTLRIQFELHQPTRLENVIVTAGDVQRSDVQLTPEEDMAEAIEVVGTAEKASVSGQILRRQRAAAVGDAVGRAEIAKTPDSNAAQAAQRVVGATIVGNRFVYVRGLGERYTNSLLNGAPLPSPEPDRAAVPLDVFPALVLDSITIAKTFTPDVPGDFAGGSVRIETRDIPTKPLLQLSLGLGYDTNATFRERLDHRGGQLDFLGFDDGTRALPDLPGYQLKRNARRPDGETVSPETLQRYGHRVNSYMSSVESFTPPNHSVSVAYGQGWDLGGERRLGVLAAASYSRSYSLIEDGIVREFSFSRTSSEDPGSLDQRVDYRLNEGVEKVRWSTFGSFTYQLSQAHRLHLTGIRNQLADDRTAEYAGFKEDTQGNVVDTRLSYVSRVLNFGQLRGEHEFEALGEAQLDWNVFLARATRDEPDTRNTVYKRGLDEEGYSFQSGSDSGRHFTSEQEEDAFGGGLDWTQPFAGASKLKFGGLLNMKQRSFRARRLAFVRNQAGRNVNQDAFVCEPGAWDRTCPDRLFRNANIGGPSGDYSEPLVLEEGTREGDYYDAHLNVYGIYVMTDAELAPGLRVIAGQRVEITDQAVEPINPFGEATLESAEVDQVDWLPSASLVFDVTPSSKLRGSVSRTLARPQLRELAPFQFSDYFGGKLVSGNKDLELTRILNVDLRFEYFPSTEEVLAFSWFYKDFKDPIEPVVVPGNTQNNVTYRNAPGANLIGVELEARKKLGFLNDVLRDFSLVSNLTLTRSKIEVEQIGDDTMTNLSRPLVNQAPWVLNLALDYSNDEIGLSARALYNVAGAQIDEVGTNGLDDAYLHSRHVVDLSLSKQLGQHVQLKLTAKDVLQSKHLITQGPDNDGNNVINEWRDGSVYTLAGSYTF